jgi:ribosome recycling factor
MISEITNTANTEMEETVAALSRELAKVRTGKAQVSMLEGIMVNYYGSQTPLSQVAALSCPDSTSFLVAPWDASVLKEIETSIVNSDIGMTPMSDGKVVRLKLPELNEERRKDIVKQVGKIVEEARIAIRMKRKDANDNLKDLRKSKEITEDDNKKTQEEVQKITDNFIKKIDLMGKDKEKEVMTL